MNQLELYRRALPPNEFAALEAWVSTFYPFQRRWLLDPSDYAICNKSRQIGLSHTSAALGVVWGVFHGQTTTILSRGELESAEVLDKAKRHVRVLQGLGSKFARLKRDSAFEISFPSGGRVMALPSTGGRGFTGNMLLDEFAYHERDDEKVWDAAMATTTLGGKGRVISTPNGRVNKFADVWAGAADPNFGWSRHEIPIELAIAEGYPVDLKKCWSLAANNQQLFGQLFQCQFIDADTRYLFKTPERGAWLYDAVPRSGRICIGIDFAATAKTSADYSVAVVLLEQGGLYYVLDVLRMQVEPREFRDWIPVLLAKYPGATAAAYVAATEKGGVEFIRDAGISITGMLATVDKFQRAIPAGTAWNLGHIRLPAKLEPWVEPFRSEVVNFTGNPKKDRHDDQVDALAAAFDGLKSSSFDLAEYEAIRASIPKAVTWLDES